MKQKTHIGAYAIVVNDNKILLIKKVGGPYDGKLDLPGGTIEFNENPTETLKRELKEEVGIDVLDYNLFDVDSTNIIHDYKGEKIYIHHIGIFYKVNEFKGQIKEENYIDEKNDDSKGASYYDINILKDEQLSSIANLELKKLRYK